ncbi:piggyBac transposable element-derived protein 4 [Drosophila tropicalis]|uniref:piggyBac transposable element-derived protein 4 n=1 Tax=Drosophila tropicalis TaxID=46794 RepID=UPI0035AB900D
MSSAGRKRKQQLKPRQDDHRSPLKRSNVTTKEEQSLVIGTAHYPALADYGVRTDIKPDLTEQQLQVVAKPKPVATPKFNADFQESDSDEEGYSEPDNAQKCDVFFPDEDDIYDPKWNDQPVHPRLIFKFNLNHTGLKAGGKKFLNPSNYFYQILGQRNMFFSLLSQSCNQRLTLHSTAEEMEIFIGLNLIASEIGLLELVDYWNQDLYYGFTGFQHKMSLARFQELMQSLNFDLFGKNNNGEGVGDVNPLIEYFNKIMSELYVCGQKMVLNDPLMLWKGKFNYFQDLPEKFRANSLMLHMLTEQNGLIIKILPEIISKSQAINWMRNSRDLVECRNELALKLVQDYGEEGRTLYVSKFYGSFGLAHELAKIKTYCTGLLDRNRYGNSKALVHQQLEPNSIGTKYAQEQPLMMAKWRRRQKTVYFFSSDCLAIYAKEMSMQKSQAKPKLIQELDWQLRRNLQQSREQLTRYQPGWSSHQWDKKLLIFLINLMVHNSYLLYVAHGQSLREGAKTYKEFRVAIVKSLLKEVQGAPTTSVQEKEKDLKTVDKKRKPVSTEMSRRHEMIPIEQHGKPARKNCRHCHKDGMLQFTKFMCNSCPDKPGLCPEPCFQLWHDQSVKK